jgi:cytoskeletal protein CcmA (bactofilin family)
VSGQNIDFNGKCKGNLIIEEVVTLRSESLVAGNIRSFTVGMETGAAVRGEIQSTSERTIDESVFDNM